VSRPPKKRPIHSQLPGTICSVEVEKGETVQTGKVLLLLESMKMEIAVQAASSGRVAEILVGEGQNVVPEQVLIWLDELGD